jgi:glutamine synthetase
MLAPGQSPAQNLQFLIFFISIIKSVYLYADILRASLAHAANDHRLGANEAPPAIISIFLGTALAEMLKKIETGDWNSTSAQPEILKLADLIPHITKDTTDRNRTSPFAFTGNKFEIRMPGSSVNCAGPMTITNTILGKQLIDFKAELDKTTQSGVDRDKAIMLILQQYLKDSSSILFEGDNYSEAWRVEAAKRNLSITSSTPEALEAFTTEKAKKLFADTGVYSNEELHGFYDVKMDNYFLCLQIESRTMGEMIINHIIPAALEYQTKLAANVSSLRNLKLEEDSTKAQLACIQKISNCITALWTGVDQMTEARKSANALNTVQRAWAYMKNVKPLLDSLRIHADRLEYLVPDKDWPLIKYREMLFLR